MTFLPTCNATTSNHFLQLIINSFFSFLPFYPLISKFLLTWSILICLLFFLRLLPIFLSFSIFPLNLSPHLINNLSLSLPNYRPPLSSPVIIFPFVYSDHLSPSFVSLIAYHLPSSSSSIFFPFSRFSYVNDYGLNHFCFLLLSPVCSRFPSLRFVSHKS